MKKFKRVLLFVFLATVWLNIGYYVEKSEYEANIKYLSGAKLNTLEKLQMGPNYYYAPKAPKEIQRGFLWQGTHMLLWPIVVLAWAGAWMVKGVIIAALAVWYGLVWLFRFVFCGGFFRLIGPAGVFIVLFMCFILILISTAFKKEKRKKSKK